MARASGSMTRATAKAPPTGIRERHRSSARECHGMLPDREKLSVAVRNRADRTFLREVVAEAAVAGNRAFPREVAVAGALTAGAVLGNQAFPSEVEAIVLLEEVKRRGSQARQQSSRGSSSRQSTSSRGGGGGGGGSRGGGGGGRSGVAAVAGAVVVAAEVGAGRNRQTTLNGPPMVTPIRFCHGQDHG